jgi:hypothetical protein
LDSLSQTWSNDRSECLPPVDLPLALHCPKADPDNMIFVSFHSICLGCLLSCLFLNSAAAAAPSVDTTFFEKKVRPVLVARCYECHGSGAKVRGGLRVDSREALLRGGDRGPALLPGRPEESLLVRAIRHDGEVKMPPKTRLSPRELADLTAWVQRGAPWPNDVVATPPASAENDVVFTPEQRAFWAFQPPHRPALPAVRTAGWVKTPIDAFILAGLEERKLHPSPPADKRTLIRRATFDLTGLPPTPEEIEAFLTDASPTAFARVVERLLASPAYGERWGRHWLDVARYADSNGMDENLVQANAYRYRDYVVSSFNHDKPYDRFVREQLAGDLLPAASAEQIIATGFLSLGPKMLAEDDPVKMEMDIVDEQIDTVGRAFLGLTLGCARCHDHKFDPISIADYYALAGIFKSTKTMDNFRVVARWHERALATPEKAARQQEYQRKIDAKKREIDALRKSTGEANDKLERLRKELVALVKDKPDEPMAMAVGEGTISDVRIHLRGNHLTPGRLVPRGLPRILAGDRQPPVDSLQSGRLQLAQWLTRPNHPLTARVLVNRIWRWHFGQGLVRSPDNFGRLGDRPVNQPLLDWLAVRFVADGWSIKSLHRLIMLSATYQMSTVQNADAVRIDPENRLHGRWERRRLEAEEVRDALLAISGQLDRTIGGSLMQGKNRAYVPGYPNSRYDRYESRRRSLYLPVIRSDLYPVFQAFDFADPSMSSGDRPTTTVATQALFMMNSKLVREQTQHMACNLLDQKNRNDTARVRLAYEHAYGRKPTDAETARALAFIDRVANLLAKDKLDAVERRLRAWQSLCRVIVSANEFIYVE